MRRKGKHRNGNELNCDETESRRVLSTAQERHWTSVIGDGKATQGMNCDVKKRICEDGRIAVDFAKKYAMEQSSVYADYVVREMKSRVQLVPNAHRFAGFVVLKSPNIPSVLLEMGYLSNRQEEKLMWKKSYRQKLSKALVQAVKDYFKNNPAEN